jgi:hypothetical protein
MMPKNDSKKPVSGPGTWARKGNPSGHPDFAVNGLRGRGLRKLEPGEASMVMRVNGDPVALAWFAGLSAFERGTLILGLKSLNNL